MSDASHSVSCIHLRFVSPVFSYLFGNTWVCGAVVVCGCIGVSVFCLQSQNVPHDDSSIVLFTCKQHWERLLKNTTKQCSLFSLFIKKKNAFSQPNILSFAYRSFLFPFPFLPLFLSFIGQSESFGEYFLCHFSLWDPSNDHHHHHLSYHRSLPLQSSSSSSLWNSCEAVFVSTEGV